MSAIHALVVAAGAGTRFGGETPKQYLPIQVGNKTACVLQYSVEALACHSCINECTLVVGKGDEYAALLDFSIPVRLVVGGVQRWQSVLYGVQKIAQTAHPDDWVLIHDGARPCLSYDELSSLIEIGQQERFGALLATPLADTLKRGNGDYIDHTVPREGLWCAQTPQLYRLSYLLKALAVIKKAQKRTNVAITDEAMGFEALGLPIRLVQGSPTNLKLTYPGDVPLVQAILAMR